MAELPPDLERLGAVLADAASAVTARRRHRLEVVRRLLACLAAGWLVLAFTAPSRLVSSDAGTGRLSRTFASVTVPGGYVLTGACDPHGGPGSGFQGLAGCEPARPPAQAR